MFENIMKIFKKTKKKETINKSKVAAKERLQLVLMQDRANVSVDFLDLMRQEIIEVIKKYIDIDEETMDVRLENKENEDGTQGAPALYANIPIINIKEKARKLTEKNKLNEKAKEEVETKEEKKEEESIANENKEDELQENKEAEKEPVKVAVEESKEEIQENNSKKESENE